MIELPVHGFVLAGGKSSRMGADKALLDFCGRPMVEIAVAKLREFCADVWIAGNRCDLSSFAPVVGEERADVGPGGGIEAGLSACTQEWALFIPVDVPLLPGSLLRTWVSEQLQMLANDSEDQLLRSCGARLPWASYLFTEGRPQFSICLLHRDCASAVANSLDAGTRRLSEVFEWIRHEAGIVTAKDPSQFVPGATPLDLEFWLSNVNTPQDLEEAETWARSREAEPGMSAVAY